MKQPYGPPSLVAVRAKAAKKRSRPCPIPNAHDKIEETHYFLHQAAENYHWPDPFRWNLNAFLQALRSATLYLQSEGQHVPGFDDWYVDKQTTMKNNELLCRFKEGRNVVVHKGMLLPKTRITAGVFDYRHQARMALRMYADPWIPSDVLLRRARRSQFVRTHMRGMRAEGWQPGLEREWIVDELGDTEVTALALDAYLAIAEIIGEAHEAAHVGWRVPDDCKRVLEHRRFLLEDELPPAPPRPRLLWVMDDGEYRTAGLNWNALVRPRPGGGSEAVLILDGETQRFPDQHEPGRETNSCKAWVRRRLVAAADQKRRLGYVR